MAISTRLAGTPARVLGAALLALATLAPARAAEPSAARTVTNIAQIEWDQGGRHLSLASNRVDLAVEIPPSATLTTYRLGTGAGAQPLTAKPATCVTAAGTASVAASAAWSGALQGEVAVLVADKVHAGEPLFFAIDYAAGDSDPAKVDSLIAIVSTRNGDHEQLKVWETGPNTGRFAGYVQTVRGASTAGDCHLGVSAGDRITVEGVRAGSQIALVSAEIPVLVDPNGIVFDSSDGTPVSGAKVTLIDAATGAPAQVFGDDGEAAYPALIDSGAPVQDSRGTGYAGTAGGYRFPLVRPGRYRLLVEAPAGYYGPSLRTPADLAGLTGADGAPLTLSAASYGAEFVVTGPEPVQVAIPLDKLGKPVTVTKQANRTEAVPGETVDYAIVVANPDSKLATAPLTVTDRYPRQMRLRAATLEVDGRRVAPVLRADEDAFDVAVEPLRPGAKAVIRYAMEVRGDAQSGATVNRVEVADLRGTTSNTADAQVRIRRDSIAERVTVEGRVLDGGCGGGRGIPGVRVMLEDGSYAVTDVDGRYHFEGLLPGTHVVQMDDTTLPSDRAATDCARDTRSGGRAFSRFIDARGGDLKRVDFHAIPSAPRARRAAAGPARPVAATDAQAAGAERDWFAGQQPGVAWLFPEADHNPRAPIVRVVIKHRPGQKVVLFADGRPTEPIAFEGDRKNGDNSIVIAQWRGIPVQAKGATELTAEVRNADGSLAETLRRTVRYGASPMRAELVRERSRLVADGVTRPVFAVRFTDSDGRPVRHGLVGDFEVPAPYYPAVEADAQQARQLAGLERARPVWHVTGEDGVAYIELEPTTASGSVSLRFPFRDGQASREQRLEAWLDPGDRPWTIVGLAEGTLGYNRLDTRMEQLGAEKKKNVLKYGRLAFYAKGRILGRWLMTLAYDSKKKESDTRFAGVIDPTRYYTVYADRSERRYDAASVKKLYLKLERPQFYALFGDFQTGIDEPQLARYVRAFTGAKAEYRSARIAAIAYAAEGETRHRRDDIQGNGLSGPYALGARSILPNSERVTIEVRDRLRSEKVVESRQLARYVDYEIDYAAGTVRFKQPILSRDSALNPQFVVAEYEVDGVAGTRLNAGGRASWRSKDRKLQVAATGLHDADERGATNLAGADVRYRPNAGTELRAEIAVSDRKAAAGTSAAGDGAAKAWLVEAEHHGARYDALAYARQQDRGFGVGQLSGAESGTRKIGFDGRVKIDERLSVSASGWIEDHLGTSARRVAGKALVEYKGRTLSGRAGLVFADDRLRDGRSARSTLLQLGATKRLLANKLEIDAQTEIPLGQAGSVDFPAQHRLTARYTVRTGIQLVGAYEIAHGKAVDARTARIGFDIQPWAGAKIALTANQQDIAEYGPRSFAAFGLSQSVVLGKRWSVDASLDSNKTLHGIDPSRLLNPLHPVASGGFIGGGSLTEDFTAVTGGATYRARLWSVTGRAEYRAGDQGDRYGVTAAALRQIGEGSALGAALDWFTAKGRDGAETRTANLQLSWAHRPAGSAWSWLEKLELREDAVTGAVAGRPDPLGAPFTIGGNARSRRVVNALSLNYTSGPGTEIALFWGTRYASDRIAGDDVKGWSNLVGLDIRFDLSSTLDVALAATVREGAGARAIGYSVGPALGLKPFDNGWISLGWNLVGFHDRDFEASRYTRSGPYVTMRLKFDQLTLKGLGLGGRR